MAEFVNEYGDEYDDQPFDQKRWFAEPAVCQQRADDQQRWINFDWDSEDFHFKLFRSILPRSFFGRLPTNTTRRGYLCIASRVLTNSCSWRARSSPCS